MRLYFFLIKIRQYKNFPFKISSTLSKTIIKSKLVKTKALLQILNISRVNHWLYSARPLMFALWLKHVKLKASVLTHPN